MEERLWKINKLICGDHSEELAKLPKEPKHLEQSKQTQPTNTDEQNFFLFLRDGAFKKNKLNKVSIIL